MIEGFGSRRPQIIRVLRLRNIISYCYSLAFLDSLFQMAKIKPTAQQTTGLSSVKKVSGVHENTKNKRSSKKKKKKERNGQQNHLALGMWKYRYRFIAFFLSLDKQNWILCECNIFTEDTVGTFASVFSVKFKLSYNNINIALFLYEWKGYCHAFFGIIFVSCQKRYTKVLKSNSKCFWT